MIENIPGLSAVRLGEAPGLAALRIENPFCRATVALQGAQLLEFQATGEAPLLWLSERAVFTPGKAIRGGIPLCFPWFGPHPEDAGKPAHGFARNREWVLTAAEYRDDGHRLLFSLGTDAGTRQLWPHEFAAALEMQLGAKATLRLFVKNLDTQPFRFGLAFHSYFPVADIGTASVHGLAGSTCIDQLAGDRTPRPHGGPVSFSAETDRIYLAASGHYEIHEGGIASIGIEAAGCRSAIVWNPWREKTARLGDMADDAWRRMLCVECGNAESDQLTLAAGAEAVFELQLRRLTPGG